MYSDRGPCVHCLLFLLSLLSGIEKNRLIFDSFPQPSNLHNVRTLVVVGEHSQ